MKKKDFWGWKIGFSMFFGFPIYLSSPPFVNVTVAFLVHLALIIVYATLLKIFGHRSVIEMGIFVGVWSVAVGLIPAILHKAESNRQRQKQHTNIKTH